MTAEPKVNKPKVKDEFLADLIRHFGAERGVELYQEGTVSKDDLATFTALLAKFGVEMPKQSTGSLNQIQSGFVGTGQRKPFVGTDPS